MLKDTVEITKLEDGKFELTRVLTETVDRLTMENNLQSLKQTEEQLLDQLEAVRLKAKNIEDALELTQDNDKVKGKGAVVNLKKKG
jgi:hypothetical protein